MHLWGEERLVQGLWWGNMKERDHYEETCINGKVI